jgi:glycerophosphoryl diester phosphodiesterase
VLNLFRGDGRPLVVGHRGAASVAPENTIEAFRTAVALGVDIVELDVLALDDGPLVVAHSERLDEVTHGAAHGRVGSRTLAELRELAPALPTFEEAIAWFAVEAPATGIHVDLKLRTSLEDVVDALARHAVSSRTVVTSASAGVLQAIAQLAPDLAVGLTYPEDRLQISRKRYLRPAIRAALISARASVPPRLPRMLSRAGAHALMLQHTLVSPAAVVRAHAHGVPVLAWTVDAPSDVVRVTAAGVDGVITNDPAMLLATLKS